MATFPDLTVEFDPKLFDDLVSAALSPTSPTKDEAEAALLRFKEHPDALIRIDAIMNGSKLQESRFIAMQILEENVRTRWNLLTEPARASVRQYVFSAVTSATNASPNTNIVLHKMNAVLVEIVKRDWPQKWPSFINDLITVAQATSMSVASNALAILREVNEQVFLMDREMTTARRRCMQATLSNEYFIIFRFISTILEYSESQELEESLLKNCMYAFCSFCKSMPLKFVFSTRMVESIIAHLNSPHSISTLECLTEIVTLKTSDTTESGLTLNNLGSVNSSDDIDNSAILDKIIMIHNELTEFFKLYVGKFDSRTQLQTAYKKLPDEERLFLRRYAQAFSALFSRWLTELGSGRVTQSLQYFVQLSRIDDPSLFAVVFPTWAKLVHDLYSEYPIRLRISRPLARDAFEPVLRAMLPVFISHMPRPDEVFIRVNELGEVIRDRRIETTQIEFSKKMQHNLFLLSFIIGDYMKEFLENSLSRYISKSYGSDEGSNTKFPITETGSTANSIIRSSLFSKNCWAVGALAGAFDEAEERTFFIKIIQTLLTICELRYLKEEKAVIASNIMFIIGQYHRFLKHSTEFLAVVLQKLFEFMAETYEGIKEMACDNFFRICESCPTHLQQGRPSIFDNVLSQLGSVRDSLDFSLQRTVLEGLLLVIQNGPRKDPSFISQIYSSLTNYDILNAVGNDQSNMQLNSLLRSQEQFKELIHLIESYSIGLKILPGILFPLINFNLFLSILINLSNNYSVGTNPSTLSSSTGMNTPTNVMILKKSISYMIITAINEDQEFIRRIHEMIIEIFKGEGVFLDVATAVVNGTKNETIMAVRIRDIMTVMLVPSMHYVQKADETPEEAAAFLRLFMAMVERGFTTALPLVLGLPGRDALMNSVFLSLTGLREVSSLCLRLLLTMVQKCRECGLSAFFELYYFTILENLLGLLFDGDMRKTYDLQAELLLELMVCARGSGGVNSVGGATSSVTGTITPEMVRLFIQRIFNRNFSNVTMKSLDLFITGLLEIKELGALRGHLDDFNIKINEYGDDSDIPEEEAMLHERVRM